MFGLGATFLIVVLEYAVGTHYGRPVVELSFVPLAWLAIRHGMRGAVLGVLIADATATVMHVILAIPLDSQVEYQGYLVASSLMALLLGAATADRNALLARLERRAYVDDLTNLPNRERLVSWIRRNRDKALVLVMLDIDDMRLLNEGVGRLAADRVLQEFASRLADELAARVLRRARQLRRVRRRHRRRSQPARRHRRDPPAPRSAVRYRRFAHFHRSLRRSRSHGARGRRRRSPAPRRPGAPSGQRVRRAAPWSIRRTFRVPAFRCSWSNCIARWNRTSSFHSSSRSIATTSGPASGAWPAPKRCCDGSTRSAAS